MKKGIRKMLSAIACTALAMGCLAGIMFFWVLGKRYVDKQVNTGREKPFTGLFFPICKYIYIPICFLVLILGIALGGIG